MTGASEVLCRSALQLGLGFTLAGQLPGRPMVKFLEEQSLLQRYSFRTTPSGPLRPPSDHRTFCLVGALLKSLSNPVLGLHWHQGPLQCTPEKVLGSVVYLENSLNKISKTNEVDLTSQNNQTSWNISRSSLGTSAKSETWCGKAWDVNWIYEYFWVNFLKIKLESNTALLWPQGLPSACRSGSRLQGCWKQTKRWSWAKWHGCNGFTKLSMVLGASSYKWSFLERGKQLCSSSDNHSRRACNRKAFKHLWADEELHRLQWSWLQLYLLKAELSWGRGWRMKRKVRKKLSLFHVCTVPAQWHGWLQLPAALE